MVGRQLSLCAAEFLQGQRRESSCRHLWHPATNNVDNKKNSGITSIPRSERLDFAASASCLAVHGSDLRYGILVQSQVKHCETLRPKCQACRISQTSQEIQRLPFLVVWRRQWILFRFFGQVFCNLNFSLTILDLCLHLHHAWTLETTLPFGNGAAGITIVVT